MELNESYWSTRYQYGQTGWDIGHVSTPIKEYVDQLEDQDISILIPGAGNAYEAEYLWNKGFRNITIIDLSKEPLHNFRKRVPDFNERLLIQGDFFDLTDEFDMVIEQTFFCALNPALRQVYVKKMSQVLRPKGKLVGLLLTFHCLMTILLWWE